jgi:hypothetical protein
MSMSCDGVLALDYTLLFDPVSYAFVVDSAPGTFEIPLMVEHDETDWRAYVRSVIEARDLDPQGDVLDLLLDAFDPLVREHAPTFYDVLWPGLPREMQDLYFSMNDYLYLRDTDYITAVLAAAAAKPLPDDPLWLMVVMPSSSGKNEAQRLLEEVQDASLKDVTLPGLLAKGNTGLLPRLAGKASANGHVCDALVTIADFSALLKDERVSGATKEDVFTALRDIYDGEYSRDIFPTRLTWSGRLSLIASCTPAIDRYTKHADALGTRWLYFRGLPRDLDTRRAMARMATGRTNLRDRRLYARDLATPIVREAQARVNGVELPDDFETMIHDAATLVGYGRAVVPREWRNEEVDDIVEPEEPGRVAGQLRSLARGCLALGASDDVARRIVMRAAVSSMPQARARVLAVLAREGEVSTNAVSRATGMEFRPTKRALQDWQAIGFVASRRDDDTVDTKPNLWSLAGKDADFVRRAALTLSTDAEGE